MAAKAGFYALALGAALVMASLAMVSDEAMAQADDAALQAEEAPVEAAVATPQAEEMMAPDEAAAQPVPMAKPATVDKPVKSDLDQSAVAAAPVVRLPRATRTSTRSMLVPKILGSYR